MYMKIFILVPSGFEKQFIYRGKIHLKQYFFIFMV